MAVAIFGLEDELAFKQRFAIEFLAAHVANRYSECCSNNTHDILSEPPVEDAEFLAEKAWEHWVKVIGLREVKGGMQ